MVVDGTLVKAWASHRSFQPKDDPLSDGGNFRGKKRSNKTHVSSTDSDARLIQKGPGKESMLCHLGHTLVDSVSGLVRACRVTKACGLGGNAEVLTALDLADEYMKAGQTLVADRGYDDRVFVDGLRERRIRAHPRAKSKNSRLDGRTTTRESYKESMKKRYKVEVPFAWIKGSGRMRQTKLRGTEKVGWELHLYCIAYDLRRMANHA